MVRNFRRGARNAAAANQVKNSPGRGGGTQFAMKDDMVPVATNHKKKGRGSFGWGGGAGGGGGGGNGGGGGGHTRSSSLGGSSIGSGSHHGPGHHRRNSATSEDEGSLTYSATSSISGSSAGESTDSSFADIMKVLDMQDQSELDAYLKKEGIDPRKYKKGKSSNRSKSGRSVHSMQSMNSLQYSVDDSTAYQMSTGGGSALDGEHLLQTITGQPSDSGGFDGGPVSRSKQAQHSDDGFDASLFAEADPAHGAKVVKGRRGKKKIAVPRTSTSSISEPSTPGATTPQSSSSARKRAGQESHQYSPVDQNKSRASSNSNNNNPSSGGSHRGRANKQNETQEPDFFHTFLMCGFADDFIRGILSSPSGQKQ